jgi:large subunit ribosomal protein L15
MPIGLNNLHPNEGSTHKKKRVGRGPGSGLGKTAGRGNKGQKSRSGYSGKTGFEGGQMPLQRRLPKRGFTNIFKKQWIEVTLATLEKSFESGEQVTPEAMHERGVIAKGKRDVVVLGTGELTKGLTISAHRFTKGAREKIERAGGSATVIAAQPAPEAE